MGSNTRSGVRVRYVDTLSPGWTSQQRATHYREQSAQFLRMAEAESQETARERLLDLARQYDRLAVRLDTERDSRV